MSKLITFFKIIPLFFGAISFERMIVGNFEERSYVEQFIIGVPLLLIIVDLMRLMELIIAFGFSKKEVFVISLKRKKIKSVLGHLDINMIFLNVQIDEKNLIARKINFENKFVPISKARIFKSLINERYYAADRMLFMLLFSKVFLLNLILLLIRFVFYCIKVNSEYLHKNINHSAFSGFEFLQQFS